MILCSLAVVTSIVVMVSFSDFLALFVLIITSWLFQYLHHHAVAHGWPAPASKKSGKGRNEAIITAKNGMEQVLRMIGTIKQHLTALQLEKSNDTCWIIFFDRVDFVCLVIFELANLITAIALNT